MPNPADARRSLALRTYHAARRNATLARVRELHARGLFDTHIARELRCSISAANNYRRELGLPIHTELVRANKATAARLASASRTRNLTARNASLAAALNLPPVSGLARRAIESLASGPLTRLAIASRIGAGLSRGSHLPRLLPSLRASGLLASTAVNGRFVWSLAPSITSTFSRSTLAPLQQGVAADPRAISAADAIAASYIRKLPHLADEILSAARFGLVDAARRFDPTRCQFSTFLTPRVRGSIMDALRDTGLKGYRRDYNRTAVPEVSSEISSALSSNTLPIGWELASLDALDAITRSLPHIHCRVVRLHYGHCLTMRAIGSRLGVRESRVSQLYNEALAMLRTSLPLTEFPHVRTLY